MISSPSVRGAGDGTIAWGGERYPTDLWIIQVSAIGTGIGIVPGRNYREAVKGALIDRA
jgi:hypothetical protein